MGTIEVVELSSDSDIDDIPDFDANDPENIDSQRKIWEKLDQQKKDKLDQQKKDEEFAQKLQEKFQSELEATKRRSPDRRRSSVDDAQKSDSEETKKTETAAAAVPDPEIRIGMEEESDTEGMEVVEDGEIESHDTFNMDDNQDDDETESIVDDTNYSEILKKKCKECVVKISEAERAKADEVTRFFIRFREKRRAPPEPDYGVNISLPKVERVQPKRPRCDEISCPVCRKIFENQAAFKTHYLECHPGLNLEQGNVFPTQPKRRHWEQRPIKTKTHKCITCGAELFESQVESHIKENLDEYHNVERMDMINEESQPKQKVQK